MHITSFADIDSDYATKTAALLISIHENSDKKGQPTFRMGLPGLSLR